MHMYVGRLRPSSFLYQSRHYYYYSGHQVGEALFSQEGEEDRRFPSCGGVTISRMDETQPLLRQRTNEYTAHRQQDKLDGSHRPDFDPNGDPDDPQNWKTSYKWGVVLLLAFMAFSVTFNCIGLVPVANNIVADLDHASGRESSSAASVLLVTI